MPAARSSRLAASYDALRRALGNRDVRRVESAWAGCITGEWAVQVGLTVAAFRAGGVVAVGLMALVRNVPAAAVGPFLAAATDRLPRGVVLLGVLVGRSAIIAEAGALLVVDGPLGVVFALAALDALVYTLWWPAQSALLPQVVNDPAVLTASNVSTTIVENLGAVAGPAVAAVLIVLDRPDEVLLFAAAVFAASAVLLVGMRTPAPVVVEPESAWRELTAGFRTLRREAEARLVVAVYLVQSLCVGAVAALVVVISVDLAHTGTAGIGWLGAVGGIGGAAGAFASLALVGRPHLAGALGGALVVWGAALGLVAGIPGVATAVIGLAVLGSMDAVVDVAALTLLQRLVPDRLLGRVLGVFEGLWWAAFGIGALIASRLAQATGARAAVSIVACVLPVVTLVAWLGLRRVDAAAPAVAGTDVLVRAPMFAALPAPQLEALARAAEHRELAAGAVVVRRGDIGDEAFVIVSGQLLVDTPAGQVEMGPGEVFGEIALLNDVPRTATVTTLTDSVLMALPRTAFLPAVMGSAGVHEAAAAVAAERLAHDVELVRTSEGQNPPTF